MRELGMVGLGAFGRLMVRHLAPYFRIRGYDPDPGSLRQARRLAVDIEPFEAVASSPILVLATPVQRLEEAAARAAPLIRQGAMVLDVSSVKVRPLEALARIVPEHADVIGTHPLFGPQSAADGVVGKEIVLCPVRSDRSERVRLFLERALRLKVSVTTPERHDADVALVQGLTHLIAKVIAGMGEMPERHRTDSFDMLMRAIEVVRYDSDELFRAIEQMNPYAPEVTRRFFEMGDELRERLHGGEG